MKDAKGHGSNARSGSTFNRMNGPMPEVMQAAQLAKGNPKADPAPPHTGMVNAQGHAYGSPEALRDFTSTYGGPRNHAAEQRGFNRGRREINRLKRQGK